MMLLRRDRELIVVKRNSSKIIVKVVAINDGKGGSLLDKDSILCGVVVNLVVVNHVLGSRVGVEIDAELDWDEENNKYKVEIA